MRAGNREDPVRHSLPTWWAFGAALWAEGPRWLPDTHQGLSLPSLDQKWIRTWDHRARIEVGHLSEESRRSLPSLCPAGHLLRTSPLTVLSWERQDREGSYQRSPCSLSRAEFSQLHRDWEGTSGAKTRMTYLLEHTGAAAPRHLVMCS